MAKVKSIVTERDGVELEVQEEVNPSVDSLEAKGVVSPGALDLEDSTGTIPLDRIRDKDAQTAYNAIDNSAGALEYTDLGSLQFSLSAGHIWEGFDKYTIPAVDTSSGGTFTYVYDNGGGGFTAVPGSSALDNTSYDNGTGTLANVTADYYVNHWLYVATDGTIYVVYGQQEYASESSALAEQPPTNIPGYISSGAYLRQRIVLQQGSVTIDPEIYRDVSSISTHNDLTALQGGIQGEYYHLTAQQISDISNLQKLDNIPDITLEPTGFDRNAPVSLGTISFDSGTLTLTHALNGGNIVYYRNGTKVEFTSDQTVVIPDTEGLWFFYYNESDVLTASQTPWTFIDGHVFVAVVYWDATNNLYALGEERHGITMDNATHGYLHNTAGAQYKEGFLPSLTVDGNGSLDAHAEMQSITAGQFYDEDIININSTQTTYEIWWKEGANGDWRWDVASAAIVKTPVAGRPYVNTWSGTAWELTEVANNDFSLMHIFATNRVGNTNKIILIMGEVYYASLADAQTGANIELFNITSGSLPTPEFLPIGSVVIETKTNYNNAYNAAVVSTEEGADFVDFRDSKAAGGSAAGSGGTTDVSAIHDNEVGEIAAVVEKTIPVATDVILGEDSANANSKVRFQIGNLQKASWDWLVVSWTADPTLNETIAGGDVYNYTYGGTTYYRFVPSPYDASADTFYAAYSSPTLSLPVATRGQSI